MEGDKTLYLSLPDQYWKKMVYFVKEYLSLQKVKFVLVKIIANRRFLKFCEQSGVEFVDYEI